LEATAGVISNREGSLLTIHGDGERSLVHIHLFDFAFDPTLNLRFVGFLLGTGCQTSRADQARQEESTHGTHHDAFPQERVTSRPLPPAGAKASTVIFPSL
jgi:hypothetical protein